MQEERNEQAVPQEAAAPGPEAQTPPPGGDGFTQPGEEHAQPVEAPVPDSQDPVPTEGEPETPEAPVPAAPEEAPPVQQAAAPSPAQEIPSAPPAQGPQPGPGGEAPGGWPGGSWGTPAWNGQPPQPWGPQPGTPSAWNPAWGAPPPQQPPAASWGAPPQNPAGWTVPAPGPYGVPAPAPGWSPYGPAPRARKPLSRGLKVFLWIASALAAGAILGFACFAVYAGVAGGTQATLPETPSLEEQLPQEQLPSDSGEEQAQPELELPDVEMTPNTDGIAIQEKPAGDPLDAQQAYDKVVQSTVSLEVSQDGETTASTGTGIIATSDGYMITNAHVVLNSKNVLVTVTTYDGQTYDAVVVGVDRSTDLAVIKTNDYGFTPAEFGDAAELSIGEWVLAIGNPGGSRFAGSVTRGIVSGLDRAVERYSENGMTYIQTDAAINPGNSGGPLVNMYGQVVGINSSKIITEGYEGMGFAIPVSRAKEILDQLLAGGYVQGRVRLGISGYDVSEMEAMLNGTPRGFLIASIDEDSAFADTQAQEGDIITALDGESVQDLTEISNLLLRYSPGDQVTVTLFRINEAGLGEELEVEITLLEDKGETQQ